MSCIFLPEKFKIVTGTTACVTTNGGVTGDNIKLRDAQMVWIVASFTQAVSHATTIQPVVGATDGTCSTSITFSAECWKNADISSSDTLSKQTSATSMACTAGATNQLLVIKIDPQEVVNQSATYDWLGFTIATSSQASNFVDVQYFIETAYPQATPPAAIS